MVQWIIANIREVIAKRLLTHRRDLNSYQSQSFNFSNDIFFTVQEPVSLEDKVGKVPVNKEIVGAVFFDVEKAYGMLWREGLLVKMHLILVSGSIFHWVVDFLKERI